MFYKSMFWDGRAATLEEQATMPILNPIEMGQKDPKDVVAKLAAIPEIVEAFQKVFGHPVNWEDMGKALAAFERTRLSTEAPFDRFLMATRKPSTPRSAGDGLCSRARRAAEAATRTIPRSRCLATTASTIPESRARKQDFNQLAARDVARGRQSRRRSTSWRWKRMYSDLGRFLVTQKREDIGAFKTPFLRDVLLTGPYMHDGSLETLWDVVEFFNKGGERNPFLDAEMKPLGLRQ